MGKPSEEEVVHTIVVTTVARFAGMDPGEVTEETSLEAEKNRVLDLLAHMARIPTRVDPRVFAARVSMLMGRPFVTVRELIAMFR